MPRAINSVSVIIYRVFGVIKNNIFGLRYTKNFKLTQKFERIIFLNLSAEAKPAIIMRWKICSAYTDYIR
uniref:DUF2897 family protein n=1 Tax=Anaerocolumna chitinilytica TaxID=1727145 RepID=UPI001CEC50F5